MIVLLIIMLILQKKRMQTVSWYGLTDTAIVTEIGKRLRLLRVGSEHTQQQLADRTGLSRSTIRDIERGKPVALMSLLPVLRELNLLDSLDTCFPSYASTPVLASEHRHRQRVRPTKSSVDKQQEK